MIVKKSKRWISFLKTTAIGGLIFLLPLIVVSALIGQVANLVTPLVQTVSKDEFQENMPDLTGTQYAMVVVLSIVFLLLLCFAAGLVAKWSIGRRVTGLFEKYILLLFPRYAIIKDQMADSIGGAQNRPNMKGVVIQLQDQKRIGFETDRSDDGQLVTVYLPGSPDTWAGHVAILDSNQVVPLESSFGDTVTTCEQLGRGSFELMKKVGQSDDQANGSK